MGHKKPSLPTENFNNSSHIQGSEILNESKTMNQNFIKEFDNGSMPNLSYDLEPQILIKGDSSLGKKRRRGRKKKGSLIKGKHDKYYSDNLFRKIKSIALRNLYTFINSKIHEIYKYEPDYDMNKDMLKKIKQEQIVNSNIEFNKEFLNETLEHIFSVDISKKFKKYNSDHNRNLIIKLLNDNNIERRQIFHNLFTKTFLECLEHFRGTKNINELEGINTFEKCKEKFKDDYDYLASLEYTLKDYENIISKKRGRKNKI
jgi:hypothetical protein